MKDSNDSIILKILGGRKTGVIYIACFFVLFFLSSINFIINNETAKNILSPIIFFGFIIMALYAIVKTILYFK